MNLGLQNASNIFVPLGSIEFVLNVDSTVLAAPYGFVSAAIPIIFQLDANGNILPNAPDTVAQIWSNLELSPQNSMGLGTWYAVTVRDQDGARLSGPMAWQFNEPAGSTVNISAMTPYASVGGNLVFYPSIFTTSTFTLFGSTSGSATITAPAVAGNPVNPFQFSNAINIPAGTSYEVGGLATTSTLKTGSALGDYSTNSTAFVNVDPTNLSYTAVVPVGWKLIINAAGNMYCSTAMTIIYAALADNGVVLQQVGVSPYTPGTGGVESFSFAWIITGDGNSHNVTLQYCTANSAEACNVVNNNGHTGGSLIPTMTFLLLPSS